MTVTPHLMKSAMRFWRSMRKPLPPEPRKESTDPKEELEQRRKAWQGRLRK